MQSGGSQICNPLAPTFATAWLPFHAIFHTDQNLNYRDYPMRTVSRLSLRSRPFILKKAQHNKDQNLLTIFRGYFSTKISQAKLHLPWNLLDKSSYSKTRRGDTPWITLTNRALTFCLLEEVVLSYADWRTIFLVFGSSPRFWWRLQVSIATPQSKMDLSSR